MICSDPLVELLKSEGYCAVRLPRSDIAPLQIIARDRGGLAHLGDIGGLFHSDTATLPRVRGNEVSVTLSGRRSGALKLGLGISLLSGILAAMGGSGIDLSSAYRGGHKMALRFDEVLADSVDLIALDAYLGDADVLPHARHTASLLEADQLYVITATLKSRSIAVVAYDGRGVEVSLDVTAAAGLAGGAVTVAGDSASGGGITYRGRTPLVFGFRAVRVLYHDGCYSALESLRPGVTMRGGARPPGAADDLRIDSPFAPLHFQ